MGDEEEVFEALPRKSGGRGSGDPAGQGPGRARVSSRDMQVCRQIRDRLDLVVGGELDDPALEGLAVLEVSPIGNLSSVRVRIAAPAGASLAQVQARLGAIAGRLRWEAAAAIHRKRTPSLCFEVVLMGE